MSGAPACALLARPARGVDLAHHAGSDPVAVWCLDDLAHELVAQDSREGVVALHELQIGAAYAREQHSDECLIGCARRRHVTQRELPVFKPESLHVIPSPG